MQALLPPSPAWAEPGFTASLLSVCHGVSRDRDIFSERGFSVLVADQAHVIKNPDTAIAKTAKSIPADFRIAFSGTLVENGLKDMRARFDFVLPGYLGGPAEFKRDFRVPIEVERNKEVADYLKTLTVPFLLRRLKSD